MKIQVLRVVMHETCGYRDAWDPVTLEPLGPECGARATEYINWKDGRTSAACPAHGMNALTRATKALVSSATDI